MKPRSFTYDAPTSLEEALSVLAADPDDSKVLAGGQSLVPMMNFRLASPAQLVDINRVPGLSGVETVGDRVEIVIPPADGYGSKGNPQGGIKGTDTLVFVVDIVGAV